MTDKDKDMQAKKADQPLFSQDADVQYIYKKAETITGAIFLVTNLIPDADILKKTIREQSLAMLAQAVTLSSSSATVVVLEDVAAKFSHIHSLLDIAFWSGLISQMNSGLLQKEIEATQKTIYTVINRYKSKYYIDSSFFMSQALPQPQAIPQLNQIKDTDYKRQVEANLQTGSYKGQNKGQDIKDITTMSDKVSRPIQPEQAVEKNERKEAIIKFLREKPSAGIKDFASVLQGYSEKTIQRELAALVNEGVLRKQGDRRWSTYSLA